MAVYNSPEDIKDAGLSEVTLELSAIDTATIMDRLVHVLQQCDGCMLGELSMPVFHLLYGILFEIQDVWG